MILNIREAGKGNLFRKAGRVIPLLLTFLLLSSSAFAAGKEESITAGEIALYVGLIVAVIGLAWFLTNATSKKTDPPAHPPGHRTHHHHHHRHPHHRR